MDGNIINGGDVVRKILDFGDEFIRHLVEKNYVFYAFQSWHGLRLNTCKCVEQTIGFPQLQEIYSQCLSVVQFL